jgi:hypothetical protein
VVLSPAQARHAVYPSPIRALGQVRLNSNQPKQIGKGKENERYNYNTSMSFSDDIDPDVGHDHCGGSEVAHHISMSITAE